MATKWCRVQRKQSTNTCSSWRSCSWAFTAKIYVSFCLLQRVLWTASSFCVRKELLVLRSFDLVWWWLSGCICKAVTDAARDNQNVHVLLPNNLFCKCLSILQVSYTCLQEPFGCVNAVNASVPSCSAMAAAILFLFNRSAQYSCSKPLLLLVWFSIALDSASLFVLHRYIFTWAWRYATNADAVGWAPCAAEYYFTDHPDSSGSGVGKQLSFSIVSVASEWLKAAVLNT